MDLPDVLSGEAGLAGVRWLLLGPGPRRLLRDELATMLGDPRMLGPCRLRRAKFKPGRKLTAYYDVDLLDPRGGALPRRPIAATWTAEGGERRSPPVPEGAELAAEAAGRGLAYPFGALEAQVPNWSMQLLVSPLDARFPHLVRLSDPSCLPWIVHGAGFRVTPIRYRPGQRHVLRYDLERRDGSFKPIFAKLYADQRGERIFEIATRVADWLASNGSGSAAVRPVAYLGDTYAVVYPGLAGAPLSRRLRGRGAHRTRQLRRAGALLRTLHRAPSAIAAQQEPHNLAAEVRAVARASEHIRALEAEAAPRIAAILEWAQELHDRLPHEDATLVHGDFKLDHLWLAPEGLTLIDPDRCCLADPALDVGKFLADLQWWQLTSDRAGLREFQGDFLSGYAAASSSPRIRRARVYEAVLLVKIAARRVALFDPRWCALTAELIARSEGTLADLESECRTQHPSGLRQRERAATA
jgi:aminoglycoside phosphotransferase (APT) family kinase protein